MLNGSLCDFSDVYILAEGAITVVGQGTNSSEIAADRNNKKVAFKNWAPFISCISKIKQCRSRQCWRSSFCDANV